MTFGSLFLFWLHALLAQEQWRIVDGRGAVQVVSGAPALSAEQRAEVRSAWVWTGFSAPRKVAPERIGLERFRDDAERLAVRVVRRAEGRPPADLRLIAAPAEMWNEIPEGSLPSWPVPASGRLAIPLDPARPWRLRAAGSGEGSFWVEVRPGQAAALVTATPASGIDLAVLDPEGAPVAAVFASLQEGAGRGGSLRRWAGVRGETGRIGVPGLPDGQEIALSIHHPSAAPLVLRGQPSAFPREVRLAPGAELTGRVAGLRGAPLAGVTVQAEAWTAGDLPQVYRVQTASDVQGAWHLRGLPPGKVALSLRAPGFVPFRETLDAAPGTLDLGLRTLEAGTVLEVHVADDAGAPVPGARIVAGQGIAEALADSRGIARLEGLPSAPILLRGTAPRHLFGEARVNPPFSAGSRLVLKRALTLTGRLLDPAGEPVGRGLARIESGTCQSEARLEEGGRFELAIPPDTRGDLVVRSPATRELRLSFEPGEPGEVRDLGDLAAPASLTVTGRVIAEGGGAAVPGARVWTTRQGPDGPAVAWATRDLLEGVAGEDGRFQLSGLVPAAPALLRVDAPGFARAQVPLSPERAAAEGGVLDLGAVTLRGGAAVHVRVDPDDVPAEGAMARVDLGNRWLDPDLLVAAVLAGEAVVPNVPAGLATIAVLAGRRLLCAQVVEVPAEGSLDVECRRPALTVAGQVLAGGVPAGAGVLTWQVPGQVPARIDTIVSPAGLRQQQVAGLGMPQVDVAVGADGRFESGDLLPGRWQVSWRGQSAGGGGATAAITVEVPEVERFETVLPFAGRGLAGQVVDRDGQPAPGARVRELTGGALAFAGADGRFSLPGLATGNALVQAQLGRETSELVEIELAPGREPEPLLLTLGEARPPVVEVRVVDAEGTPAAGAFLFVEEEGKGQRLASTAADGRATVTLEPPLPARVRVAAFAAGAWGFGPWVSREEALRGLTLQAGGGGALLVRSQKRHGAPRIVTGDGWDLSWLLRLLGAPPVLREDEPCQVTGLPAGTYTVSLDGATLALPVADGQPAEGRLE